jgi:predicted MFS family arabinose efflux permease
MLTILWVMAAQALSGIAKDLNKMSAKGAIKLLVPEDAPTALYRWVATLTGSKNALKGLGFFMGGLLLATVGFRGAVLAMAIAIALIWLICLVYLQQDLGKAKNKPKFTAIFSKSRAVNCLSAARLFLFAARDVWFVVALPVYLAQTLGWDAWSVGSFLAVWVMGYGLVQTQAPRLTGRTSGALPDGQTAVLWAAVLAVSPAVIALALTFNVAPAVSLLGGLLVFGFLFAVNSSLHSYLIVSYADADGVALDIGFYYMANALGRLAGTILSGWIFQAYGLAACLWFSALFVVLAALLSLLLPTQQRAGEVPPQ